MVKWWHESVIIGHFERVMIVHSIHMPSALNRHGSWSIWCLRNASKTIFFKWLTALFLIPQIVEFKWLSEIIVIGHFTASIIVHYHAPNMAAVFSGMLREPQTASLSHPDISNPWLHAPCRVPQNYVRSCCQQSCPVRGHTDIISGDSSTIALVKS